MADSNSTSIKLAVGALALLVTATSAAHAQQGEDLREAAQNPIGDLISLPFQNNTNFDIGRHRQHAERPQYSAGLSSSTSIRVGT